MVYDSLYPFDINPKSVEYNMDLFRLIAKDIINNNYNLPNEIVDSVDNLEKLIEKLIIKKKEDKKEKSYTN